MKKFISIWIVALMAVTLWSCGGNSSGPEVEEASAQKQFVWNAMNFWYYWQGDVPELADNRFSDDQAFQEYLNGFSDAEALFNELVYEQEDDFSFFIDNYEEFQQSQQGISKSFGFEFGLVRVSNNSNEIFGYVQYVISDSPADQAGLKRGDLFTGVDGTQLTVDNYRDLLLDKTSYELTMAIIENNTISETGETVSMDAITLTEDPVFLTEVIDTASTKVGYLMYNAFHTNTHQELNDVFGDFKSQNIDELVIDLRYNGGGAGLTSQTLAGMISGRDSTNVFATYRYNQKRASLNQSVSILNKVQLDDGSEIPMNQLSLDRVYVLTGFGTASASEVLINGLEPYMQVVLIGDQTVGKDEGSYTLYDAPAPYLDESQANPDHKIAIQPIVVKVVNSNGRDYPDGFEPDYAVNEIEYLEDLPPLGDTDDPLLAKALELITGQQPMAKTARTQSAHIFGKAVMDSRGLYPHSQGYYIRPPEKLGKRN